MSEQNQSVENGSQIEVATENKTRMAKLIFSLSLGLITLALAAPVYAQSAKNGSYYIDKNKLEVVKPYNAPRQIDIIDGRPIVHNHLTADQQADVLEINAAIPAAQPGRHIQVQLGDPSGSGAAPYRTGNPNLNSTQDLAPPSDMFVSNIPARPMFNKNLPPGQNTGIHGPTGSQAASARQTVDAHLQRQHAPVIAEVYAPYTDSGTSSGQTVVRATVGAKLKSPLRNRLLTH